METGGLTGMCGAGWGSSEPVMGAEELLHGSTAFLSVCLFLLLWVGAGPGDPLTSVPKLRNFPNFAVVL